MVGYSLACKYKTSKWLKVGNTLAYYDMATITAIKSFIVRTIVPCQYYKKNLGVIYATYGICPYDFDWGYIDSDIITPKKFYIIGPWCQSYKTFYVPNLRMLVKSLSVCPWQTFLADKAVSL